MRELILMALAALFATAVAMFSSSVQAGEAVYVTHSAAGLPVYTNQPMRSGSTLVMVFPSALPAAAPPLLKTSFGEPPRTHAGSAAASVSGSTSATAGRGIDALIRLAARTHDVEEALLRAVIDVESGFDPAARSPAGAMGLMQLMPDTARRYGVVDAHDPAQNIDGGTRYLKDLLAMFGGDLRLALAAYNAGEGAVLRYGRRIPPFAETQAYVPAVLARYRSYLSRVRTAEGEPQR